MPKPSNPLIVQSDKSVLLEVDNPLYEEVRDSLARFAELVKSPEYVHTYRITPLSLWNAAAAGMKPDAVVQALEQYAKYPIPGNIAREILDYMSRYGQLSLLKEGDRLILSCATEDLAEEIWANTKVRALLLDRLDNTRMLVDPAQRGFVKQILLEFGHPVDDIAGYVKGEELRFELRSTTLGGRPFKLKSIPTGCSGYVLRRWRDNRRLGRGRASMRFWKDNGRHGHHAGTPNIHSDTMSQRRCGSSMDNRTARQDDSQTRATR